MSSEKYLSSPFRQLMIVFYKTIDEFDGVINYIMTEMERYVSIIERKNGWATIIFKDNSIVRIYDIKSLISGLYNFRWTSIMVTSGCTKKDIENLEKSPLLHMSNGSYANENIMRVKKPENIFGGAKPVKCEEDEQEKENEEVDSIDKCYSPQRMAIIYKTQDEFDTMWRNCFYYWEDFTHTLFDYNTDQKQVRLLNGATIRFGCLNKAPYILGEASLWTDVIVTPSITKDDFDGKVWLKKLIQNSETRIDGIWVYKDVRKMQNLDQDLTYIINGNAEYY